MDAVREAGLRIPDDIAIGSIDNTRESQFTRPPLTTVHIPKYEIGVLAMQKLKRIIMDEDTTAFKSVVYSELIVANPVGRHVSAEMRLFRESIGIEARYGMGIGTPPGSVRQFEIEVQGLDKRAERGRLRVFCAMFLDGEPPMPDLLRLEHCLLLVMGVYVLRCGGG